MIVIECFLHAFLRIRDRAKRLGSPLWDQMQQVWESYHAPDATTFRQRLAAFHTWAQQHVPGSALAAIDKLAAKAERFALAFDYPNAHRTSNMVDRHRQPLARWLFNARAFHGDWASAERQVRAWTLFHNFWPYCPLSCVSDQWISPVHKLTGTTYHHNWLHNLLIASSIAGVPPNHKFQQN